MYRLILPLAILCAGISIDAAAETPVMGWSSSNTYRVNISDSIIRSQADALVALGLKDAGYKYINIEDGFFGGRDSSGRLMAHPKRFPNGLRPVVDHIHALGLKAGIYSDAGRHTCGNFWDRDTIARGVGMYEHDDQDARFFFNEMGFDYIKVDFCGGDPSQNADGFGLDSRKRFTDISDAILRTGRSDVKLNVCRWAYPGTWVSDIASSWRVSHDVIHNWQSVSGVIAHSLPLSAYCRDGKFNDMDKLVVGHGLTPEEDTTHFAMWCIMSSPLIIGSDLTAIDSRAIELLSNPELIAINQDPLGQQAYIVGRLGKCYLLAKDLIQTSGCVRAIAIYNPSDRQQRAVLNFDDVDLGGRIKMRDLITRQDLPDATSQLTMFIPPHSTRVFRLEGQHRLPRRKYEAETAFINTFQEITNNRWTGTAIYERDERASGGYKAISLGSRPDNDLAWDNVDIPEDGTYRITIAGFTSQPRSMHLDINGADIATLTLNTDGTVSADVELNAAPSRIRLWNADTPMPDIDYMTITLLN